MSMRTTRTTVTFARPFSLGGIDGERPPGTYALETDEALIEGLSFPAYRRTATWLLLPPLPGGAAAAEAVRIDPLELEAAQADDRAAEPTADERRAEEALRPAVAEVRPTPGERDERARNLRMLLRRFRRG